jgi:gluconolactonase
LSAGGTADRTSCSGDTLAAAHGVIFTTDLALPEAPALLSDGSWLVAELAFESGTVKRISPDGTSHRAVAKTGRPNGIAVGSDDVIWVCESLEPAILRLELSGGFEPVLTEVEGVPLLWPNDLCFGPDGALYVTDSGLLVREFLDSSGRPVAEAASLSPAGIVFRFDPRSREAWLLDDGYRFTNGIAFGPDGLLYVNETMSGNVYRYRLRDGRVDGGRELFANVLDPEATTPGLRGPDGMAFSEDGRLWVTVFGQGDVTVLAPDGTVHERLKLVGRAPTNIAFGERGEGRIYVVEDELGQIEAYDVGIDGLPLHSGPPEGGADGST